MFDTDLDRCDAKATLAQAQQAWAVSERAKVRELEVAAHWADLHGVTERVGQALPGCERLTQIGGVGTPEVAEFCGADLGAVMAMSDHAAASLMADALDLRHRLPTLWARVQAGEVKAWIGRNCATSTRQLSLAAVAVVDRRVAAFADRLSWGRLESLIQATWMQADPDAAEASARSDLGVWVNPSAEHGTKSIFIRVEAPDAIRFDGAVQRVADGLRTLGDQRTKDARRAEAVGVLAHPQAALDLFEDVAGAVGVQLPTPNRPRTTSGVDPRPPVTLYVHLSEDALASGTGVARVEGVGPVTVDRIRDWLSNSTVSLKPVIDLNHQIPVDAYEIPDRLREAVHLRSPIDCFPYATNDGRRIDIDHSIAYVSPDEGGPPGQTRLDNLGPFTRFHHRVKTHSGWQVVQVFSGVFVWRSPHGYTFLVDHTGTRPAHRPAA